MPPRPDLDKLEQPSFSTDENAPNIYTTSIWDQATGRHKSGTVARFLLNLRARIDEHKGILVAPNLLKQVAQAFMFSAPDLVDPIDSGAYDSRLLGVWEPVKSLGQGGFGKVGLWVQNDHAGNIVDEMAIKEARLEDHGYMNAETRPMREAGIAEEAVFQAGLQAKERKEIEAMLSQGAALPQVKADPHILHLRRYKFHPELGRTRLYMLYAPHRTLADLARAYSAFDQPLPEAFVWALFHSLILVVITQEHALGIDSPLYRFRKRLRNWDEDEILHCDIKPQNIVLDYSAIDGEDLDEVYATDKYPDDFSRLYPRACLTDYGIALDTTTGGDNMPHEKWGTPGYKTPEQLQWGANFKEPPNSSPEFGFTLAHDAWLVGKVILDLIADWDWKKVGEKLNCSEYQYRLLGKHFLARGLGRLRHQEYSQQLRVLVRDCVTPEASKRPGLDEIWDRTSAGISRWKNEFKAATNEEKAKYRLFFRDQDIHKIPVGRGPFPKYAFEDLWQIQDRNPEMNYPLPPELLGNFNPALGRPGDVDIKKPPYPDRMDIHDSHVSFGGPASDGDEGQCGADDEQPPQAPATGQDASKGQDDNEHENRPDAAPASNAVPPDPPLSNASVTSQDPDVQDLLESKINDLRKRLKKLDSKAQVTGKGITKKHIAKQIVKMRRPGSALAADQSRGGAVPTAGGKSKGKKGKSTKKGQ